MKDFLDAPKGFFKRRSRQKNWVYYFRQALKLLLLLENVNKDGGQLVKKDAEGVETVLLLSDLRLREGQKTVGKYTVSLPLELVTEMNDIGAVYGYTIENLLELAMVLAIDMIKLAEANGSLLLKEGASVRAIDLNSI